MNTAAIRKKKKGAGGKLHRTEILQFRLNPRSRFALELMARSDHRTVSSFIEKLVDEAIKTESINVLNTPKTYTQDELEETKPFTNEKAMTLSDALKKIWHTDEAHRFVFMAYYAPSLLTYEEERLWDFLYLNTYYWRCYYIDTLNAEGKEMGGLLTHDLNPSSIIWEHLQEHWELLKNGEFDRVDKILEEKGVSDEPGETIDNPESSQKLMLKPRPDGLFTLEPITVE